MKIYDISQELFSCIVWPGDPAPKFEKLSSMNNGDSYNLTAFSMCAHNGTHIDAPSHFINGAKNVDDIDLKRVIGESFVVDFEGEVTTKAAEEILDKAMTYSNEAAKRILIKGKSTVTLEAARKFAEAGIYLIGNESQTVGPESAPMEVHKVLLTAEVVLLEGVRINHVPEGTYFLNAAPINLAGSEGSPCRAVLISM